MRFLQRTNAVLVGVGALLLLTTGGMMVVAHADENTQAFTADQIIACVRTAVAAQPGLVKEVEAEYERGQWLCEVDIVDAAGHTYEVQVDVTTNQVVKVERD
jgi:uncharacterized membrane protein YkoI